jgi:hypothetical protein
LPPEWMTALIWLGVTAIVIAIAEIITVRRRRTRLAAFPGKILAGRSLWQKRRWAFGLGLAIFIALFVFFSLPGSSIGSEPASDSFPEKFSFAFGAALILLVAGYSMFFERIIAFDEHGGTLKEADEDKMRFEWSELQAAGTIEKHGIWVLTQRGNIHWLSIKAGYDNVITYLRNKTGDHFYEDCDPHSVMQRDRATDAETKPAPPMAERIYARPSLKYSWQLYLIVALPVLFAVEQLYDAIIYSDAVFWGMLIVWIPAVAINGGILLLTLFRRRYFELSPEGWRRCGHSRGKLIEWRYCSRFSPVGGYGVCCQYGPAVGVRPINYYGHPPEELADRLNAYREAALAASN